ncbi:pyrroline-5-carboxylate reductase [Pseudomonas fluorescens]|uniref:Pyrroline-5-carboxylate reductase n=1 Tax=Pseudomonas fluorescens TaxID=294 RepID=A0A5E7VIX0_PSEFL|nr:pyrroline-5-carboxylate reductase [Pseudomonas fluorescens]VVO45202.1 Pyrroline-5-carboxylate reductase [Pseudomonas fluorescens]VVQ22619.1 Pyrroline-5-carboxylate reductase [Pseudomonas fluorescens]
MNVLFIGYGRMGSAIGEAWLATGLVDTISAIDPHQPPGLRAALYEDMQALTQQTFELIVIAVKPDKVCSVAASLPDIICKGAVVISVAAGITTQALDHALSRRCPVIRAMPNTPVLVKAGCTALYTDSRLDDARRALVSRLFDSVGRSYWLEHESLLDAVTAISGSGPAYYHLFSEALVEAGVLLGLTPELALDLATQTAFGAACQQVREDANIVDLRTAVTSPKGTTAAAIAVFEQDQALRRLIEAATQAAHRRSQELSTGR